MCTCIIQFMWSTDFSLAFEVKTYETAQKKTTKSHSLVYTFCWSFVLVCNKNQSSTFLSNETNAALFFWHALCFLVTHPPKHTFCSISEISFVMKMNKMANLSLAFQIHFVEIKITRWISVPVPKLCHFLQIRW